VNPRVERSSRRTAPAAVSLALLGAGLVPLASCASTGDREPAAVRAAASIESPRRRLQALAEIEAVGVARGTGDAFRRARAIDPGLPEPLAPGSAEFRRASRPLADLLAESPVDTPASDIRPPAPADRAEAARLYTRARAARQQGDEAGAIELLDQAVDLDPGSPTLWQELGEARIAAGDRAAGVEALTISAELGSEDPRVLLTLASEASSRGDSDSVVTWAGAAWRLTNEPAPGPSADGTDRASGPVAGALLGSALLERGDLLAGAEALEAASRALLETPPRPGDPVELVRLRASRAELQRRLGDAWAALGQPARAADAYRRAGEGLDRAAPSATRRAIAALVAADRPATGAIELLAHAEAWRGDLTREEAGWVRGLAESARVGPALIDALTADAFDPSIPPTARRQLIALLAPNFDDPGALARRLSADPALSRSTETATDLLVQVIAPQRGRLAAEAVGNDPASAAAWGAALTRLIEEPLRDAASNLDSRDPARRNLGLGMALELQRPDLAAATIDADPTSRSVAGVDPVLVARLAGIGGRWERASVWLDAAREAADADGSRQADLIEALLAAQRVDEAGDLAESAANQPAEEPAGRPGVRVDALLAAAEVALFTGEFEQAIERLNRAAEIDPFDDRVWDRRIGLRATETPVADQDEAMRLGREISERRPRSALFAVLRAREMAGQNLFREAANLLIAINDRAPGHAHAPQVLAQVAQAAAAADDPETLTRTTEWLAARAEGRPGATAEQLALAQVLLAADQVEPALERLDDALARAGQPDLARAAEAVLIQRLDRADQAVARAGDRLASPVGVDAALERAEVGVSNGRWEMAISGVREALPPGPGTGLTGPQAARWSVVALGLVQQAQADPGLAQRVVSLLDDAADAGISLPEQLVRGRLLLLARSGDQDRLRSFVEQAALGADSGLIVVQALLAAERTADALALLASLTVDEGGVYEDMLSEWIRLAGALGSADDVRSMIERLESGGHTAEAARLLVEELSPGPMPGERIPARARADVAYTAGLVANVYGRDAEAEAMYRLALEHDAGHVWAANDLGYALADRGESLDEAETLLQRAYEALPGEASIVDSIGWVRYKLGVLNDAADGRPGALTLLRRASETEEGRENPTIFEHLGDTYWRLGRRDDARKAWTEAELLLRRAARELAASPQPNARQADRINSQLGDLRRRINDAEAGNEPAVAPIPSLDAPARAAPPEPPADPGD
jgi:tetratricopeptide (TPR) repeat protein